MNSSDETRQLWPACPPLTTGAILPRPGSEPGFKLLALENQTPGLNVYRAYDLQPARRCPECGNRSPADAPLCAACGTRLTETRPTNHVVFVYETPVVERLGASVRLALQPVRHACLFAPFHAQQMAHGGVTRFYVATPEPPAPALADLRGPHSPQAVLAWGKQVAEALAQIHGAGVMHGQVSNRHILVQGNRAWLTIEPGRTAPPVQPNAAADVRNLARILLGTLTETADPLAPVGIAEPIRDALLPAQDTDDRRIPDAAGFGRALTKAAVALDEFARSRITAAWGTDLGLHRASNEDSLTAIQYETICAGTRETVGVFAVADGAGGHADGELASRAAVQAVGAHVLAALASARLSDASAMRQAVSEAITAANARVRALRQERGGNMLTTLVLAFVHGRRALIANIGDSRCYVYTQDTLKQVTTDHTLVARLVALGQLTPIQARDHPKAGHLYRAVGQEDTVETDFFDVASGPGDLLLLCSDGLHSQVEDEHIADVLRQHPQPSEAVAALIQAARAAGGRDNITAIVVRL